MLCRTYLTSNIQLPLYQGAIYAMNQRNKGSSRTLWTFFAKLKIQAARGDNDHQPEQAVQKTAGISRMMTLTG